MKKISRSANGQPSGFWGNMVRIAREQAPVKAYFPGRGVMNIPRSGLTDKREATAPNKQPERSPGFVDRFQPAPAKPHFGPPKGVEQIKVNTANVPANESALAPGAGTAPVILENKILKEGTIATQAGQAREKHGPPAPPVPAPIKDKGRFGTLQDMAQYELAQDPSIDMGSLTPAQATALYKKRNPQEFDRIAVSSDFDVRQSDFDRDGIDVLNDLDARAASIGAMSREELQSQLLFSEQLDDLQTVRNEEINRMGYSYSESYAQIYEKNKAFRGAVEAQLAAMPEEAEEPAQGRPMWQLSAEEQAARLADMPTERLEEEAQALALAMQEQGKPEGVHAQKEGLQKTQYLERVQAAVGTRAEEAEARRAITEPLRKETQEAGAAFTATNAELKALVDEMESIRPGGAIRVSALSPGVEEEKNARIAELEPQIAAARERQTAAIQRLTEAQAAEIGQRASELIPDLEARPQTAKDRADAVRYFLDNGWSPEAIGDIPYNQLVKTYWLEQELNNQADGFFAETLDAMTGGAYGSAKYNAGMGFWKSAEKTIARTDRLTMTALAGGATEAVRLLQAPSIAMWNMISETPAQEKYYPSELMESALVAPLRQSLQEVDTYIATFGAPEEVAITHFVSNAAQNLIMSYAGGSLGSAIAGAGTTTAAVIGATPMGLAAGEEAYVEGRAQGMAYDQAVYRSVTVAAIETLTEAPAVGSVMENLSGTSFVSKAMNAYGMTNAAKGGKFFALASMRVATEAFAEGGQEVLADGLGRLSDTYLFHLGIDDATWAAMTKEEKDAYYAENAFDPKELTQAFLMGTAQRFFTSALTMSAGTLTHAKTEAFVRENALNYFDRTEDGQPAPFNLNGQNMIEALVDIAETHAMEMQDPAIREQVEQAATQNMVSIETARIVMEAAEGGALKQTLQATEQARRGVAEAERRAHHAEAVEAAEVQQTEMLFDMMQQNSSDPESVSMYVKSLRAMEEANQRAVKAQGEAKMAQEAYREAQAQGRAQMNQARVQAEQTVHEAVAADTQARAETIQALRSGAMAQNTGKPSGVASTGQVQSPAAISQALAGKLGIGAALGENRGFGAGMKNVEGFASEKGYIRTRDASNLGVALHEIGHMLEQKTGMQADASLAGMAEKLGEGFKAQYAGDQLRGEAFAEFSRLYMTDADAAVELAGREFVDRFENRLKETAAWSAVSEAREQVTLWKNATAVERGKATIHRYSEAKPEERNLSKLYRKLVDDKAPLKKISPKAYEAALNAAYADNVSTNILTGALSAPDGRIIGEPFSAITQSIGRGEDGLRDFDLYTKAKRAIDLDARGIQVFGEGFTQESQQQIVREMEAKNPHFPDTAAKMHDWWRRFMQAWQVDTGLIPQAVFDKMLELDPNYVPLYRVIDRGGHKSASQALSGQTTFVKRMKGSTLDTYSSVESMAMDITRAVASAKRNEVGVALHGAYQEGHLGHIMAPAAVGQQSAPSSLQTTIDQILAEAGGEGVFGASDAWNGIHEAVAELTYPNRAGRPANQPGVISIITPDGQTHQYEVFNQPLYETMTQLGPSNAKHWTDILGKVTRTVSGITTSQNPLFSLNNMIRDIGQYSMTGNLKTHTVFEAIGRIVGAYGHMISRSDAWKQYKAMGGGEGSYYNLTRGESALQFNQEMLKDYKTKTPAEFARKWAGRVWGIATLSTASKYVEESTRFAEYLSHQRDTYDQRATAFRAARDVTVDFSRGGEYGRQMNRVFMFCNASIQGIDKEMRMLFSKSERHLLPGRLAGAVINYGVVSGILQAICNAWNKEDFDKIPDDVKNRYFLIPNPFSENRGDFIKWPKPQGLIPMAVALFGGTLSEVITGDLDEGELGEKFSALANGTVEVFTGPVSSPIYGGVLSKLTNRTWFGSPIHSAKDLGVSSVNRYDDTTPMWARSFSHLMNGMLSPKEIKYLADQYSGFIGDFVLPATTRDRYTGEAGGFAAIKDTILRKYSVNPAYTNNIQDNFYADADRLATIAADRSARKEAYQLDPNLTPEDQAYAADQAAQLLKQYNAVKDEIKGLYGKIEGIMLDESLTPEEKNKAAIDVRYEMLELMTDTGAEGQNYFDAFGRKQALFTGTKTSATIAPKTAVEKMPAPFQKQIEAPHMKKLVALWEETGEDSLLPSPLSTSYTEDGRTIEYDPEWDDRRNAKYESLYSAAVKESVVLNSVSTTAAKIKEEQAIDRKVRDQVKDWYISLHGGADGKNAADGMPGVFKEPGGKPKAYLNQNVALWEQTGDARFLPAALPTTYTEGGATVYYDLNWSDRRNAEYERLYYAALQESKIMNSAAATTEQKATEAKRIEKSARDAVARWYKKQYKKQR